MPFNPLSRNVQNHQPPVKPTNKARKPRVYGMLPSNPNDIVLNKDRLEQERKAAEAAAAQSHDDFEKQMMAGLLELEPALHTDNLDNLKNEQTKSGSGANDNSKRYGELGNDIYWDPSSVVEAVAKFDEQLEKEEPVIDELRARAKELGDKLHQDSTRSHLKQTHVSPEVVAAKKIITRHWGAEWEDNFFGILGLSILFFTPPPPQKTFQPAVYLKLAEVAPRHNLYHLAPTIGGNYARRHESGEKRQAWITVEDVNIGVQFLEKNTDALGAEEEPKAPHSTPQASSGDTRLGDATNGAVV
ncbi:hypothetical protein BJ508DRAFT_311005 [Ascobolus immersus RN42]|uniref:Uncharacterized protein n=1 Tax=Ascobolus immersus RN42 TaxID=1160509 RepID=A0A3N4HT76_ASCIM|nr:hypothetical protein BJ508DRAFT_311005 [Ascobolus immersus RN42]